MPSVSSNLKLRLFAPLTLKIISVSNFLHHEHRVCMWGIISHNADSFLSISNNFFKFCSTKLSPLNTVCTSIVDHIQLVKDFIIFKSSWQISKSACHKYNLWVIILMIVSGWWIQRISTYNAYLFNSPLAILWYHISNVSRPYLQNRRLNSFLKFP